MTLAVKDAARLAASIAFASLLGTGAAHSAGCTLSSDLKAQAAACEVVASASDVGATRRADDRTGGAGRSASAAYAVEPAPAAPPPPAGETSLNTTGSAAVGLPVGGDGPQLRRIDGTVLCTSRTGAKFLVSPSRGDLDLLPAGFLSSANCVPFFNQAIAGGKPYVADRDDLPEVASLPPQILFAAAFVGIGLLASRRLRALGAINR